MVEYFSWTFDPSQDDHIFLSEPRLSSGEVFSAWQFEQCRTLDIEGLRAEVKRPGAIDGISFGAFDLPYATREFGSALSALVGDAIQWVPVRVDELNVYFFILNALREVRCVDEGRSIFSKWSDSPDVREQKRGRYRSFEKLVVDPSCLQDVDIFRPWGWTVCLGVSSRVKDLVTGMGVRGSAFLPIT